jgi:hypothetical protein
LQYSTPYLSLDFLGPINKAKLLEAIMGDTKSKTEKTTNLEERIRGGGDHHFKTTISDGKDKVEAEANTAEEAESRASDKWNDE